MYPFLPVKLLARARYESIRKVPRISCPKLLIHSPDDEVVPFALGRELFAAAAEPKRFLETRGGHDDGGFLADREYVVHVVGFIEAVLMDGGSGGQWGGRSPGQFVVAGKTIRKLEELSILREVTRQRRNRRYRYDRYLELFERQMAGGTEEGK